MRQRLVQAALDLFTRQGYDATTVGDIATLAGVTNRTYNRHFPDKREVLFGGADVLRERIAGSLRTAPAEMSPLSASLHALRSCDDLFDQGQHEQLRQREDLISSSGELQEREARKLAVLAEAIAIALVERETDGHHARLVADLAITVFKHAARLWMDDPATPFAIHLDRATAQSHRVLGAAHAPEAAGSGRPRGRRPDGMTPVRL